MAITGVFCEPGKRLTFACSNWLGTPEDASSWVIWQSQVLFVSVETDLCMLPLSQ